MRRYITAIAAMAGADRVRAEGPPTPVGPAPSAPRGDLFSFERLDDLFSLGSLIELGLSLGLLALLFWGANVGIAFLWRLGLDREHRLVSVRKGIKLAGVFWVIYWVLSRAVASLPVLSVIFVTLALAAVLYAAVEPLQNFMAAIAVVFRTRVRRGDRVAVGEIQGTVEEVDWLHLALDQGNGAKAWVPNRLVHQKGLVLQARWNAHPIEIEFGREEHVFAGRMLEQLREQIWLSPYRAPGTEISVRSEYHGVVVKFVIWSPQCAREAEEHLRRAVARYIPESHKRA